MLIKNQYIEIGFSVILIIFMTAFAGCGSPAAQSSKAVVVKATKVLQQDTPIKNEYVGQLQAKDQVTVKADVSGRILEKMVQGGDLVKAGQPLFRIDTRQYNATLLNTQAELAQEQVALKNSHQNSERYRMLVEQNAIAQQTYDDAVATEQQNAALVEADKAKVQAAQVDLDDTVVVSPITGRIDLTDLSIGNYVQAGSTTFATITSTGSIQAVFSVTENEYLRLARLDQNSTGAWGQTLHLILSDGSQYAYAGKVDQIDQGIGQASGMMSIKATFENPDGLLVPGMFARVVSTEEIKQGALLIPQRAVQQMLNKYVVTVLVDGNKSENRPVTLGPVVDKMQIIETGLTAQDTIIVDGANKIQPGEELQVEMINPTDAAPTDATSSDQ
jgi:membrane fusion protein (multidrug efflux system)